MTKLNDQGYPEARFIRTDDFNDGESWRHVAYFDVNALQLVDCETDQDVPEYDPCELGEQLTGWYASYSGPGRVFLERPFAKIQYKRNRVMVQQYGGLDI